MNLAQLDAKAQQEVSQVNPTTPPSVYFQEGASYLRGAGMARKQNDFCTAYLNLKKYFVLVTERLAQHPQINQDPYKDEYYFNYEKTNSLQPELNNLQQQIINTHGSGKQLPPAPGAKNLPPPPQQTNPQPAASSGGVGGFIGSIFGGSSQKKTLPPPPAAAQQQVVPAGRTLPPPPGAAQMTVGEQMMFNQMEKVAMNDKVQEKVGAGVARLAQNTEIQGKVADSVSAAATNKKLQKQVGSAIAANTDNALVRSLATNEKIQGAVGTAVAKTIGNKEVQKKVGAAIAKAATDKEVQKKVASGLLTMGKLAWSGAKVAGKAAVKGGALAVNAGVAVYNEVERQKAEEKLRQQEQGEEQ